MPLTLAQARTEFADFLPSSADRANFRINVACERLIARGKYKYFTDRLAMVVQENRQITIPQKYETIIGATEQGVPQYIRDPWYEMTPGRNPIYGLKSHDLGDGYVTFRSPRTLTGLRITLENSADATIPFYLKGYRTEDRGIGNAFFEISGTLGGGATSHSGSAPGAPVVALQGLNTHAPDWSDNPGATENAIIEDPASPSDMVLDDASAGFISSLNPAVIQSSNAGGSVVIDTNQIEELAEFTKGRTVGRVYLEVFHDSQSEWIQVAAYEPRDTNISLRRYTFPTAAVGHTVVALCKKRFRKAENDIDEILIDSPYVLRLALEALQYEESGDLSQAGPYWDMAVKALDDALKEHRGSQMRTVPTFVRASAGSRLRQFR